MPQWTSINTKMPKPVSEPQSSTVTGQTRATSLRNSLRGEALTIKNSSDPEVSMGDTAAPAIRHPDLPSHGKPPQGPGGSHPGRTKNHPSRQRKQSNKWLKRAIRSGSAKFPLESNNNTRLPINTPTAPGPSRSTPASYNTGPNHNMPVPAFVMADPRARSPPKAPKAMTSQGGTPQTPSTGRFNSIQSGKQPPTGPKADATPRNSPKGQRGGAARGRAMSHSNNNPKRRKYVPARKLRSLGNGFGATPASSNSGPSNSQRAIQSTPQKPHMREPVAMAKHAPPPKTQAPNSKGKNVPSAKASVPYRNQNAPRSFPQPQRTQPNNNPTNTFKNPTNTSNNLSPVMRYDPQHSVTGSRSTPFHDPTAQLPPQATVGLESTKQDPAQWEKYGVRNPRVSPRDAAGDISLEKGHQVHPARLDYFNPNYNTPSPQNRYLSPPIKPDSDIFACKDGDVIGAKAGEISATNKDPLMLERMGHRPSLSLRKSENEEAELGVATMRMGRRGLGRESKGGESQGVRSPESHTAIATTPPNYQSPSPKPPLEEQNRGRLILNHSGYQDEKTLGVEGTEDISQPLKTAMQDDRRGTSTPNHGSTNEHVVIIIDSDDEEIANELPQQEVEQEVDQVDQEDREMWEMRESQDPELKAEPEIIAIKGDAGDSEDGNGDVEMEDIPDCMIDGSRHGSYSSQVEQVSNRFLFQSYGIEDSTCPKAEEQSEGKVEMEVEGEREREKMEEEVGDEMNEEVVEKEVEKENPQDQRPGTSGKSDEAVPRWKLPPFQYYPGSCRPAVPMQLFDLVIIERLEQVALGEIFQCINAFEEESQRLTGPAFNYLLVRSFSRVRDMFMHDPLRGVDQETCQGVVKEEFGALLTPPAASS